MSVGAERRPRLYLHDECSTSVLLTECTVHLDQKTENVVITGLAKRRRFNIPASARVAEPVREPPYRAVRRGTAAMLVPSIPPPYVGRDACRSL